LPRLASTALDDLRGDVVQAGDGSQRQMRRWLTLSEPNWDDVAPVGRP